MNKKQKILALITAALTIINIILPFTSGDKGTLVRGLFILLLGIFLIYLAKSKNPPPEEPKKDTWRKRR